MVDAVFHTENAWVKAENTEFKELIHKLGTYKRAGQQILFLEVILAFISQFYGGLSEWPAYKMQDISQVELHDMSYIEDAAQEISSSAKNKSASKQDSSDQLKAWARNSILAADDMLKDLYTNPIFQGTGLPQQVRQNMIAIFHLYPSDVGTKSEIVKIDGKPTKITYPYIDPNKKKGAGKILDWVVYFWAGQGVSGIGSAGYQAWVAQMEGVQSKLQETNTLFTNMSSTEQSKYKFIMGNLKEFLGTWKSLNKNIVSVRNTALQNMARG